jgi:hypothetical protein
MLQVSKVSGQAFQWILTCFEAKVKITGYPKKIIVKSDPETAFQILDRYKNKDTELYAAELFTKVYGGEAPAKGELENFGV